MEKLIKIKTGSRYETMGSYSRAVVVDNWVLVSNTAGRDPQTQLIDDDITRQTQQVFHNLEQALVTAGASLADTVFSRVYIQNPDDVPTVMQLVGERFRGIEPATTVTCPPLGSTVYKVEIELTARLGASAARVEERMVGG
ncbi:RidA family protein [Pectobacterium cacticida]|uniref:RidA family protein n=1 Tax=Pectobacterium cacticida TaxID=69221 RepID=UPI00398881A8